MFAWGQTSAGSEAMMDDEQVAAAFVRTGGEEAFCLLVERFQNRVFRLAVSVLGGEFAAEAEEVAQDVFLEVYRHARSFRGEARFSTWLYRVALNRALDVKARARYRRPHVAADEALAGAFAADDPARALVTQESHARLERALDELPVLQQSIVRMHYWMEESVEEIAGRLAMPGSTVKSHLFRARRRLAELLGPGFRGKERG